MFSGSICEKLLELEDDTSFKGWKQFNIDVSEYRDKSDLRICWQYIGKDGDYVALDGVKLSNATSVKDINQTLVLPATFYLQNYPNPFNPATKIEFYLPEKQDVNISVYNMRGQLVEELCDSHFASGTHYLTWHADSQPSGVYFIHLRSNDFTQTTKCMLLR